MNVFEVFIDELNDEHGVNAISLVENPAIEFDWIALKDEKKLELAEIDKDKQLLMGAILVPNRPIYRMMDENEFYIIFSKDTIRKASELYLTKGSQSNTTLDHSGKIAGVTLVESWIVEDSTQDKSRKYGLGVPIGTWMGTMKVNNDDIWKDYVKTGAIKGFSIEGYFDSQIKSNLKSDKMEKEENKLLTILSEIKEFLFKKPEIQLEEMKTEDGAVLFAQVFEAGEAVFIVSGEERQTLPVGEYVLDDGQILVVTEEGVINSIGAATEEVVEDAPTEAPVEAAMLTDEMKAEIRSLIQEVLAEQKLEEVVEVKEVEELSKIEKAPKPSPEGKKVEPSGFKMAAPKGTKAKVYDKMFNK